MWHYFAAACLALAVTGTYALAQGTDDDPYIWLEEVHGEQALAWAKMQSEVALSRLKSDPDYQPSYDAVLGILDAQDRIPMGALRGRNVYNFWKDAAHPKGLWRRATPTSYRTQNPQWEVLLDVDRLAADEGKNWVYSGASCLPDESRCLISLSPGGTDAIVVREFDLASKSFPQGGFVVPESKTDVSYGSRDTLLVASDFGPGTMTKSSYPRIVKEWRRGTALADAKVIYEGTVDDIGVSPFVTFGENGRSLRMIARSVGFYDHEYFYLRPDNSAVKLPLPLSADMKGVSLGNAGAPDLVLATLREAWTPEGGAALPQGALVSFSLNAFLETGRLPQVTVMYAPGARAAIESVSIGRDAVYVGIFDNVIGSMHRFRRDGAAWTDTALALPPGGAADIASVNDYGSEAFFTYQSFLTPTTLFESDGASAPAAIKSLPPRFDASTHESQQYEATAKDGTKIPSFVVTPKNSGPTPMVLYGYGGFEISLTPWYWATAGKLWLAKGGAYAVANIRGGGEFGPAWHEAALKLNRQKAYDDYIAVAQDMITRGLTTPAQLGIMGGSNGGLLVGATGVQRPDLFGAVVCQVPLLDMIRYMKIGAGTSWEAEYGDPDKPDERAAILGYSPYQNVKAGVKYPPMFFVTATSDDRVTPVHARKMAAKMNAQGHDVLFYENTDGGHAGAADNRQSAEMWALTFVYLAQKLGLKR